VIDRDAEISMAEARRHDAFRTAHALVWERNKRDECYANPLPVASQVAKAMRDAGWVASALDAIVLARILGMQLVDGE
jgi:hypothetical protein